jgi:hypothetical protein
LALFLQELTSKKKLLIKSYLSNLGFVAPMLHCYDSYKKNTYLEMCRKYKTLCKSGKKKQYQERKCRTKKEVDEKNQNLLITIE